MIEALVMATLIQAQAWGQPHGQPGHWPLYTNPRLPLGRAGGPPPAYPARAPVLRYMPVEVQAPPVNVGPAQVIIVVPEVRVRPSAVTVEPPQVRFEAEAPRSAPATPAPSGSPRP